MTTQTQSQASRRTTWEIDPKHTLVELSVKHMMFTTVKGRFADVGGTITIDEDDPAGYSVEAEIGAASIDTREEQRDAHLRSADFLDAETYPTITFTSRRVEPGRARDELRVIGDLTIRGVTREVALDTTLNGRGQNPWGQQVAGFTAETTINRKDFGLNWNAALEAGGVLVGETVKILIEVQAAAAAS
jgi:polyisoprenoid-binding protein YceI